MKRRSNGSGAIRRLPSGSWRAQLMDGYTIEGKRNLISFTAPTKGEVQQKIREYLVAKESGAVLPTPHGKKFQYWSELWYSDYKGQVQDSTYSGYRYTLKLLNDYFQDTKIDAIKPIDINRFLTQLREEGCSNSKITKCRAMLIQIFTFAESNDAIQKNPAQFAKVVHNKGSNTTKKDSFTEEEVRILLAELANDKLGHSIRLLLGTGLRVQELLALSKDDIADDGSMVHINRAVKMVDGKAELGTTKSKQSARNVPVPLEYRPSALYLRQHSGESFIWCSGRGNLLHGVGTFRKWYYRALKEVGAVRLLPPHCCRHTYVSRLEEKGVPMEQIARLVGHSRITTTNGYLHVKTESLQAAVSVLNTNDTNIAKKEGYVA